MLKSNFFLIFQTSVKKGLYPLRPGVQGFFITCDGGRERQASHESINVINSVELVILPRSIINENPPEQQNQQPPPPPPPQQNQDSAEEQNEEEDQEDENDEENEQQQDQLPEEFIFNAEGVWWMRNFSSLHNKPRNAEESLGGQRMLYFQRIEADILNQCFRRFRSFLFVEIQQKFCCHLPGQLQWQENVLRDFLVEEVPP